MQKILVDKALAFKSPIYFHKKFTKLEFSPGQKEVLRALALPPHRVLVKGGRRFGKTVINAAADIWYLWTRPLKKVGYFSPSWDQCDIFMDEIYNKILAGTVLENSLVNPLKQSFEVSNGSKLITKTANLASQSGRGHGFDLMNIDESAFIPDEIMGAIRPTRLIGDCWELQTSNPCGHNHFYKDYHSGSFKVFSFKSSDNPMVNKKELEDFKSLMTSFEYKQEIEAEFIDDEFSVFPHKIIDGAVKLGVERKIEFLYKGIEGHHYYMGIDLGRKQDKSVINIVDYIHPNIDLVFKKEIKNDFTDAYWSKVLDEIEKWVRAFRIPALNIDQTSVGDMPTLELQKIFREKNVPCIVNGIIFSSSMKNSRDGLVNSLLLQFENKYIALPHYPVLVKQLQNVRRKVIVRPLREITSTFSLSGLDHVTALALAVQAVPLYAPTFAHVQTNERITDLKEIHSGVMKVYAGCE